MDEKLRVLNNDEVADALQVRLEELSQRSNKWTPDVLSLLLQLSDQPAQKSKIEDLDAIKPQPLSVPLTWSNIIADDPLDNSDGIWDVVDFAADGSDEDDDINLDGSRSADCALDLGTELDEAANNDGALIIPPNAAKFQEIANSQFWRDRKPRENLAKDMRSPMRPKLLLTETQMVREVIFMLLGMPTSIYILNPDGFITLSPLSNISHLSHDSVIQLLQKFARLGHHLGTIRGWLRRDEKVPLLQTFQAALALRMRVVDSSFAITQARITDPSRSFTSSLLSLLNESNYTSRFMLQVAKILTQAQSLAKDQVPFKLLEFLYDATCTTQSTGDVEGYEFMGSFFFDCFHTYLKPVKVWMENGELSDHDHGFFVSANEDQVPLDFVWQQQHHLIQDEKNQLYAPKFLHVAAQKIFTTGKSVHFLKLFGLTVGKSHLEAASEPALDYKSVCGKEGLDVLSPFAELFDLALDEWITNKHRSSSQILRQHLESQYGLGKSFDALDFLYFSRNGALSINIITTIFDQMDRGIETWNDGFVLTELFQEGFGEIPCIDVRRLAVRRSVGSYRDIQSKRRSMKVFGSLCVWYQLPWQVANIIKPQSMQTYQQIFVFLTQIQRAKHLLERQRLLKSALPASDNEDGENHLVYSLRHRLLWFSNTLLTYITNLVIARATAELRANMAAAEDVDGMIAVHATFISRLEKQCMIAKRLAPIHQAIISLLDLVILFSDTHASYTGQPGSLVFPPSHRHDSRYAGKSGDTTFDSSDDDEADSQDGTANVSYISFAETPYAESLRNMHVAFTKLLDFVVAGLRGVHRVDGEACWETLADSLIIRTATEKRYLRTFN